ncbi:hypothetical protein BP5796_05810 [Coleophoma crateriformis]|uniref:Heterokaryon incompatibility domain-containing protein n=1 Tax=Coleophoma crateriformis TaxID=565419 RepID=A0A3D8RVE8_9HELO|nr:hypothetical protein BP5796_05810 [Coleophoma crateriformis]
MATFQSQPAMKSLTEHVSAAAPDGFRWALIPEEPAAVDRRRGEIIKFDDPKSKNIKEFRYERLSNMRKRIRLLELMAGKRETSEVECQLFEGEIKNGRVYRRKSDKDENEIEVKFEALSWSWGAELPEYQILIRRGGKRQRKKASKDLVWALRYLRYQDKDRILWIDAICIDQQNVDEKNHQVQMMSQIYGYADRVCVWLGLDDKESNMAINFIKKEILQLEQFDELCTNESNSEKWQSLLLLMQRQWFFRRWVVQEIALANDAMIYCGPDQISWKDFSVAVELFVEVETATHRLSEVMKKDPRFYHVPGWFEFVSALGASLLVEATGMIFRYYKPEKNEASNKLVNGSGVSGENENKRQVEATNSRLVSHDTEQVADGERQQRVEELTEDEETDQSEVEYQTDIGNDEDSEVDGDDQVESNVGRNAESAAKKKLKAPNESVSDDPISQRRPLLSLEYLVSKLSIFEATEPRDAIYSLLAIANDGYPHAEGHGDELSPSTQEILSESSEQKPFPVNYGAPYADVCQTFIEFCIARSNKSRALDIICRPWAPDPKSGTSIHFNQKPKSPDMKAWLKTLEELHKDPEEFKHSKAWELMMKYFPDPKSRQRKTRLPSWIPRLNGAPFAMFPHAGIHIMKMGRKNADPLVGLPYISRSYDAAQGREVDQEALRFRKRRAQNAHCMFVKGFILEEVDKTTNSSQSGSIPKEWLKLGGWKILKDPKKDKGPPEEFWRTIVADRGKDGQNPPYYYSRACKESVYKGGLASGAVNTSDLINNERNSIVAQFCRRVQSVIWNRSLIKTDQGNLGIANKNVRKGDLVCILYGCSVPVILRPRKKEKDIIREEKEEDQRFGKMENILRRYMRRAKAIKVRKEKWMKRSDTEKADVRKELEHYKGKNARSQETTSDQNSSTTFLPNYQQQVKIQDNVYYTFLGECYIHGMMDGEAMRRKIKYESSKNEDWLKKKEAEKKRTEEMKSETQRVENNDPEGMVAEMAGQETTELPQKEEEEEEIYNEPEGEPLAEKENLMGHSEGSVHEKGHVEVDTSPPSDEEDGEQIGNQFEKETSESEEANNQKLTAATLVENWDTWRGPLLRDTIFELR